MANTIHIDVVSAEESIFSGEAEFVVLPGEMLELMIVKEGKDSEQGVGYLEDGTMVVVEDGRSYIGERKKVFVQSILQTDAGRMVFVRVRKRDSGR